MLGFIRNFFNQNFCTFKNNKFYKTCKNKIESTSKYVFESADIFFYYARCLLHLFAYFIRDSYNSIHFHIKTLNSPFFNKYYQRDFIGMTPFVHAIGFEAFAYDDTLVSLTFQNTRNLRSFGVLLSEIEIVSLDQILWFCNLPPTIYKIKITFSPYISKYKEIVILKDKTINFTEL